MRIKISDEYFIQIVHEVVETRVSWMERREESSAVGSFWSGDGLSGWDV
jgi:hypothetical protein